MDGSWQVMEIPAQRVRHGLGFVVVVHGGEIAPARVAAQLDQPGTELDTECQPAEGEDDQQGRRNLAIAQEDGQETRLQQQ
jgi:hypothetical protein